MTTKAQMCVHHWHCETYPKDLVCKATCEKCGKTKPMYGSYALGRNPQLLKIRNPIDLERAITAVARGTQLSDTYVIKG
jgi:hypothetical protein